MKSYKYIILSRAIFTTLRTVSPTNWRYTTRNTFKFQVQLIACAEGLEPQNTFRSPCTVLDALLVLDPPLSCVLQNSVFHSLGTQRSDLLDVRE